MNKTRTLLRAGLPFVILAAGVGLALLLVSLRPEPVTRPSEPFVPEVEVVRVVREDLPVVVRAHGTVVPRAETRLIAEIAGRVIEVSPSLVPGGFFEKDDVLLRIDPVDYVAEVEEARGRVAQADLELAQEEADAEVARADWERLGTGEPDALVLRGPQLARARASLAAARAALERAERDVERCTVRAPYTGRVRNEEVDVGQYVQRGALLADVYAVDWAEVRLPLPDSELAFVDVPFRWRDGGATAVDGELPGNGMHGPLPRVLLQAEFAGRSASWEGRIVRTEGEIDPMTRMVVAVARVEDPYGRSSSGEVLPLAIGMFVEAEIEGRTLADVIALPRSARRGEARVFVVDDGDHLRIRPIEILRMESERMLVASGVEDGERVVISPLELVSDGMDVRVAGSERGEERR